jgi:hypothetical protein
VNYLVPTKQRAVAVGALALGAFALGALALGTLFIGRLSVGRARIRRLEIDELVLRRLGIEPLPQPTSRHDGGQEKPGSEPDFSAGEETRGAPHH